MYKYEKRVKYYGHVENQEEISRFKDFYRTLFLLVLNIDDENSLFI